MSLREQIRAANRRKITAVPIPEWGITVHVRSLSVGEALDLGKASRALGDDSKASLALQLASFLVDEQGVQQYTPEQARVELVDDGMSGPINNLLDIALRQNGMKGDEAPIKGNS